MARERLLVAVDFSATAARGLSTVARFPEAELHLLHAVDPAFAARVATVTGLDGTELHERAVNRADVQLEETLARLRAEGRTAEGAIREADLRESLVAAARELSPVAILLALEHRRGLDRLPWQLALATGVPVILVPSGT